MLRNKMIQLELNTAIDSQVQKELENDHLINKVKTVQINGNHFREIAKFINKAARSAEMKKVGRLYAHKFLTCTWK